jgi:hypothetical protein
MSASDDLTGAITQLAKTGLAFTNETERDCKKMKTGTDAKERGTYSSECCDYEAEFSQDQTFTRCPKCSSITTWELVDIDWPMAA